MFSLVLCPFVILVVSESRTLVQIAPCSGHCLLFLMFSFYRFGIDEKYL